MGAVVDGQVEGDDGVATQIATVFKDMGVITRSFIVLAVPLERFAGNRQGIALKDRHYRQMERHDRVATQVAGVFKDMGKVAGFGIGLTIPLEGFTGKDYRVARQNRDDRQVKQQCGVIAQVATALENMGVVTRFGIGLAVPFERLAGDDCRVARQRRQHRQVKHHRRVAAQITAILKGMGIVARLGIDIAIPFKRDSHDHRRVALEHGLNRQMECHDRVTTQVACVFKDIGKVAGFGIGLIVPLEGFTG